MNIKIDRAEALALFHEIDRAMNFERPRSAARKTFSLIFNSIEDEVMDVEEVKELSYDKEKSDG